MMLEIKDRFQRDLGDVVNLECERGRRGRRQHFKRFRMDDLMEEATSK